MGVALNTNSGGSFVRPSASASSNSYRPEAGESRQAVTTPASGRAASSMACPCALTKSSGRDRLVQTAEDRQFRSFDGRHAVRVSSTSFSPATCTWERPVARRHAEVRDARRPDAVLGARLVGKLDLVHQVLLDVRGTLAPNTRIGKA